MRQVIQNYRTGALEVVEVPDPVGRPGNLLVRTAASVVSTGTERHLVEMAQKSLVGKALSRPDLVRRVWEKVCTDGVFETYEQVRRRLETPVALGYSASGIVAAVADGISGFRVGDRVACGGQGFAVHAETLCAPPTLAILVPPEVSMEEAAFAMVGAVPLHAIRLARTEPGEWIGVIGLGLLGLIAVQILVAWGYRVIGMDVVEKKLELAKSLGAEVVAYSSEPSVVKLVEEMTGGKGLDAVIIAAGTSSSLPLEVAAQITRIKGRVVATGLVGLRVPRHLFFERELELVVSKASGPGLYDPEYESGGKDYPYPYVRWTHGRNMAEFLRLVAKGSVDLKPLITHRFPIAQAVEAYTALQNHQAENPIGIVLQYPEGVSRQATVSVSGIDGGPQKRREPNSTIHVGFIGAGLFARTTLLPEIKRMDNIRLVGVAALTGASAQHAARAFKFEYATTDAEKIIHDPDIRCVFIVTRHDSHARLVAGALRAGKDVFVEKPLALNVTELLEVAGAWQQGKGRLMVGFNRRHSPHAEVTKAFLQTAGGPFLIHCRVNAGDVPAGSWVNDPNSGGDRVRGELCHFVDLTCYIVDASPVAVEATGLVPGREGEPIGDLVAVVHFSDGSVANLVYTARGHRSLERERVEGFRGGRIAVIENFRTTRFYGPQAPRTFRSWRLERGYRNELAAWFQAVRKGNPAPVPFAAYGASTLATLSIADALRTGGRVSLDPSTLAPFAACE